MIYVWGLERQEDRKAAERWSASLTDPIPGFTDDDTAAERELAQLADFGVQIPR